MQHRFRERRHQRIAEVADAVHVQRIVPAVAAGAPEIWFPRALAPDPVQAGARHGDRRQRDVGDLVEQIWAGAAGCGHLSR